MVETGVLMTPFFRDEILPILIFFGMFFLIYGVGVPLLRKLPHKKNSMWHEMLNDSWESSDADGQPEAEEQTEQPSERNEECENIE